MRRQMMRSLLGAEKDWVGWMVSGDSDFGFD